jgi:hypothetical protein
MATRVPGIDLSGMGGATLGLLEQNKSSNRPSTGNPNSRQNRLDVRGTSPY